MESNEKTEQEQLISMDELKETARTPSINSLSSKSASPAELLNSDKVLLSAIVENNLERVKAAISEGADVNILYTSTYISPVHVAAFIGHVEILKYLLMIEANMESEDYFGRTALHFAALNGKALCVKLLLVDHNANLNKQTQSVNDRGTRIAIDYQLLTFAHGILKDYEKVSMKY